MPSAIIKIKNGTHISSMDTENYFTSSLSITVNPDGLLSKEMVVSLLKEVSPSRIIQDMEKKEPFKSVNMRDLFLLGGVAIFVKGKWDFYPISTPIVYNRAKKYKPRGISKVPPPELKKREQKEVGVREKIRDKQQDSRVIIVFFG